VSTATDGGFQRAVFQVSGSHAYVEAGTDLPLSVVVVDIGGSTATAGSAANVIAAPSTLTAGSPITLTTTEGGTVSTTVATFTDSDTTLNSGSFSATIDWGDHSPTSTGVISGSETTGYTVNGTHIYAEAAANLPITVAIHGPNGAVATTQSTAVVADASLSATAVAVLLLPGAPLTNVVLATFNDTGGAEPVADYSTTIDWGDGTTNAGSVVATASGFQVTGSHTYSGTANHQVTVTIRDDVGGAQTQVTTQANIGDVNAVYVAAVYLDVLGRAPDPGGLAYWDHLLDSGTAVSSVAAAIAHSDEYYQNFVIRPAYSNLLGRTADAGGVKYWTTQMDAGVMDQELEADLVSSPEFYANAGGTNTAWIDAVYKLLLGRAPDASGENYWNSQLAAGQTLNQVAQGIAGSQENNTQLINDDYFHYLGRVADSGGLAYWLGQFADGSTNEDVIAGFTGSAEYYDEHTS